MGMRPDWNRMPRRSRSRAGAWCAVFVFVASIQDSAVFAAEIARDNPDNETTLPVQAAGPAIFGPSASMQDSAPIAQSSSNAIVSTPPIERQPIGPAGATESTGAKTVNPSAPVFSTTRTIAALAVVVILIFMLKWGVKRVAGRVGSMAGQLGPGGKAPSGVLSVLARYPISRGQSLVLLHMDQRILLLNQTPEGFRPLSEITDPQEVASLLVRTRDEEGDSFVARFSNLLSRFESDPEMVDRNILPTQTPTSVDEALRVFPETAVDRAETDDDPLGAIRARLAQMEGASA